MAQFALRGMGTELQLAITGHLLGSGDRLKSPD